MELSQGEIANMFPIKVCKAVVNSLNALDDSNHCTASMSVKGITTFGRGKKVTIDVKHNWKGGRNYRFVFLFKTIDRSMQEVGVEVISSTYGGKQLPNPFGPNQVLGYVLDVDEYLFRNASYILEHCIMSMHI